MKLFELERTNRVVHCKREPFDVYIGRPSYWGNPIFLRDKNERVNVLDQYIAYLMAHPEMQARAERELKGKILGCWCAPRLCHGEPLLVASEGHDPEAWWEEIRSNLEI